MSSDPDDVVSTEWMNSCREITKALWPEVDV